MRERRTDGSPRDSVDDALGRLKLDYSRGQAGPGLEARILARVRVTPQRRTLRHLPGMPHDSWPISPGRIVQLGSVSLIAVLLVAILASARLIPPNLGQAPGGNPASAATASDIPASNPPHIRGTCPLTPITRLAGGSAPEADVSGLRWRWGSVPWIAGTAEKVVWLTDSGARSDAGVSVYALRLDLPIVVDGRPATFTGGTNRDVYAAAIDTGWDDLLRLPEPGCWLLTAVWSSGASSVVVAAAPSSESASPAPSTLSPTVSSTPLVACPATPRSPTPPPQGWPGPAYVDGPFRWLLPPTATWRISGDGDKLVLDSQVGWDIGDMRIMAIPLVRAASVGWLREAAVTGDIPPGFGGGTLGFGITLDARGCWAFAYVASQATTTIVADLRQ